MRIHNIRFGFATNSSSSHSIIFDPVNYNNYLDYYEDDSFGWDFFTLKSKRAKDEYMKSMLIQNLAKDNFSLALVDIILKGLDLGERDIGHFGIDHQSLFYIPREFGSNQISLDFFNDFRNYILKEGIIILGGNDNESSEDSDPQDYNGNPLFDESKLVDLNGYKPEGINWTCRKDGDWWSLYNRDSGNRIVLSFKENPSPFAPKNPMLIDIKITDWCDKNCSYCYQGSTTRGEHMDGNNEYAFIDNIAKAQVFEIACLEENTLVLTNSGHKFIKNLNINDDIITSSGEISKIKNISVKEKDCIELSGNKGFKVICTPDHKFLSEGNLVEAKDLLNHVVDQLEYIVPPVKKEFINISQYLLTKKEIVGSRGGKIENDNFKYSSNSKFTPINVDIDSYLMFFYGIVVAEGSKKNVSLHFKEMNIAIELGEYYNKISNNAGFRIYENKNSLGITLEFKQPKFFESIFFKAMSCGYGAKNKNLSFLYNLDNKELIRSALFGLFTGDGCFSKKKRKKGEKNYYNFSIRLKSVSRILCEDVISLLKIYFGVSASFTEGILPAHYIDGRLLKESIYYSVEIFGKNNIEKIFPAVFADDLDYIKIGSTKYSFKRLHCDEIKIKNISFIGKKKVYDISLDNNSNHIYAIQNGVLTHNCGGGEPTKYPSFVPFVKMVADRGVVVNFTTRSIDWLENEKLADAIMANIGAFAFSVDDVTPELNRILDIMRYRGYDLQKFNVQVVPAAMNEFALHRILKWCSLNYIRVTLLGFKETGRGTRFKEIAVNRSYNKFDEQYFIEVIKTLNKTHECPRLAIDTTLAGRYKHLLDEEEIPGYLYHIEEGRYSAYIDAVAKKFGPSSYHPDKLIDYEVKYGGDIIEKLFAQIEPTC